jgi:hypothetical protein
VAKFQGGSFQAIQEYFQQKSCRNCASHFAAEGIQLLRQEPGVLVVRITCQTCGHPLGVAIVGTNPASQGRVKQELPLDWTRRDADRLAQHSPITFDDVLNAHHFIHALGADWQKHLPKIGRAAAG